MTIGAREAVEPWSGSTSPVDVNVGASGLWLFYTSASARLKWRMVNGESAFSAHRRIGKAGRPQQHEPLGVWRSGDGWLVCSLGQWDPRVTSRA